MLTQEVKPGRTRGYFAQLSLRISNLRLSISRYTFARRHMAIFLSALHSQLTGDTGDFISARRFAISGGALFSLLCQCSAMWVNSSFLAVKTPSFNSVLYSTQHVLFAPTKQSGFYFPSSRNTKGEFPNEEGGLLKI